MSTHHSTHREYLRDQIEASPSSSPIESSTEAGRGGPKNAKFVAVFPPDDRLISLLEKGQSPEVYMCDLPTFKKLEEEVADEKCRVANGWKTREKKTAKANLISQILSRWWYVFPQWPRRDFDFETSLNKKKLTHVELKDWLTTPDMDDRGFSKVYQCGQFPGVFRDSDHNTYDMRSLYECPSFQTLTRKSMPQLVSYVIRAYENQREIVQQYRYCGWQKTLADCDEKIKFWKGKEGDIVSAYTSPQNQLRLQNERNLLRRYAPY